MDIKIELENVKECYDCPLIKVIWDAESNINNIECSFQYTGWMIGDPLERPQECIDKHGL